MSDARQRETQQLTLYEAVRQLLSNDLVTDEIRSWVSNNLGVYFLFCLFGLAILALFLWSSMGALQTSLSFFVLRRQVWQVLFINKFLQAGYSGFQVTGMLKWGQKSNPKNIPGPKFSLQTIPCQISKP